MDARNRCSRPPLLSCLIFVLLSTFASAKLTFIKDDHEFLPCPNEPFEPILEFLRNGATKYISYAIGTKLRPGVTPRLSGRIANHTDEQGNEVESIFYTLKDLKGIDGGNYVCSYGQRPRGPDQPLTILHHTIECPTNVSTVNQGEKLTAACSLLKQGSEKVQLKWRLTDITLDSYDEVELNKSIANLNETAQPRFNGATLTCFFDDIVGVQPCTIQTSVNYPPQIVTIFPAEQRILSGRKANVTCKAEDANPPEIRTAFKVKKGEGNFTDADADAAVEGHNLQLTVDDDYAVKCEATNGVGGLVTSEAVIKVIIPASIPDPLKQTPSPVQVGSQYNVTCPAQPDLAKVTWTKNGVEVGNDKVLIQTATREDSDATLTCRAKVETADDVGVQAQIQLRVVWAPTEEDYREDTENGVKTVTIVITGNPPPELSVTFVNETRSNFTISSVGNTVTVTIVADEADLPISYEIHAEGRDEPVKKGEVGKTEEPTSPPLPARAPNNAGTVAGIIIAVILIGVCAALLVVMWKKNLLCPKKGSLDVEKGTTASSDGGISKPVELEEVEPKVGEPVEETQNKSSAPLLDDDDIKKPPVYENVQPEIIPTNSPPQNVYDQSPAPPGTPPPPPPPPPPPLASPE